MENILNKIRENWQIITFITLTFLSIIWNSVFVLFWDVNIFKYQQIGEILSDFLTYFADIEYFIIYAISYRFLIFLFSNGAKIELLKIEKFFYSLTFSLFLFSDLLIIYDEFGFHSRIIYYLLLFIYFLYNFFMSSSTKYFKLMLLVSSIFLFTFFKVAARVILNINKVGCIEFEDNINITLSQNLYLIKQTNSYFIFYDKLKDEKIFIPSSNLITSNLKGKK